MLFKGHDTPPSFNPEQEGDMDVPIYDSGIGDTREHRIPRFCT